MARTTSPTFVLRILFAFTAVLSAFFHFASAATFGDDNDASQLSPRQAASTLKDCLARTGARTLFPDSNGHGNGNGNGDAADSSGNLTSQNTNYKYTPSVVVQPASTQEVAAVVQAVVHCAGGGVRLSSYGGGHGYASYALGTPDGNYVIIDSSKMKSIHLNSAKKIVTADMGVHIGPLAQEIGKTGFGLPHGTCPSVGIAGHSLGGGWGFSSRRWGWLMDHIVSFVYVDVQGSIKEISQASTDGDVDIWWAMRGAGANNFGVVTSFTFAVADAPAKAVNYKTTFPTNDDCVGALLSLQELGTRTDTDGLPAEFGAQLLVYGEGSPGNTGACSFSGQYLGSKSAYLPIQERIIESLKAHNVHTSAADWNSTEKTGWVEALTDLMGDLSAARRDLPYYAQSLMDDGSPNYTVESARAILKAIQATVNVGDSSTSISFDLDGPVAATNGPDPRGGSAFAEAGNRNALFLSQLYNYGTPGFDKPEKRQRVLEVVDGVAKATKAAKPGARWGAYVNYPDQRLQDFGNAYYGPGLGRLKAIKQRVDPNNVFDYSQGLAHA